MKEFAIKIWFLNCGFKYLFQFSYLTFFTGTPFPNSNKISHTALYGQQKKIICWMNK